MTTPLISPSILNCDIARLEDELKKISSADIAHVDVMDNHFVPNLTWGLPVVEACVNTGILPIDAHLMIEDPDRWAPAYAEAGCASVTFHAAQTFDGHRALRRYFAGVRHDLDYDGRTGFWRSKFP